MEAKHKTRRTRSRTTASPVTPPPVGGSDKFQAIANAMREALGEDGHDGTPVPKYLRVPRKGERCPVTGISRSYMNFLILGDDPVVESVVICQPGKKRGIRLVITDSLLAFIEEQKSDRKGDGGDE